MLLQDPKNLYTAQNVLPLIASTKVTPTITGALNAVSAKLDTATLTGLDKQVYSGTDPDAVAKIWVKANLGWPPAPITMCAASTRYFSKIIMGTTA